MNGATTNPNHSPSPSNRNILEKLAAFFKLVRWPNLVFIGLSQWMFSKAILQPIFQDAGIVPNITDGYLWPLMLSYMLIGAGGNIINDYFDLNIDQINKPDKVIVDRFISRRGAIVLHIVTSLLSLAIAFYIGRQANALQLLPANFACIVLSFIYSLSLKKRLLYGNLMMAFLLSWVIMAVTFCELDHLPFLGGRPIPNAQKLIRYTILYAGFAFIVNLIREVVKDIEDVGGDRKYGCRTLPIVWGTNAAKVFAAVWIVALMAILTLMCLYAFFLRWWLFPIYGILTIVFPLGMVLKGLHRAATPEDFHRISSLIKLVMLMGILSMGFFKFYG